MFPVLLVNPVLPVPPVPPASNHHPHALPNHTIENLLPLGMLAVKPQRTHA